MAIDGTYNIVADTPIGKQNNEITLKTDGASVSGTIKSPFGTDAFSGGTVNGDEFEVKVEATTPMGKMDLECKGTVSGEHISGQIKSNFGTSPFEGTRV